jgi:hypothetical protein
VGPRCLDIKRRGKSFASAGDRIPVVQSAVSMLTELPQNIYYDPNDKYNLCCVSTQHFDELYTFSVLFFLL